MTFNDSLAFGKIAEGRIARWLRAHEWTVLPVYEKEIGEGKGPQVFTPVAEIVAPDMLAFKDGKIRFVEAKRKNVFTWYRKKLQWETGIDLRHYENYLQLQTHLSVPIWLLFLHESAVPDNRDLRLGSPSACPTGLFGNELSVL